MMKGAYNKHPFLLEEINVNQRHGHDYRYHSISDAAYAKF